MMCKLRHLITWLGVPAASSCWNGWFTALSCRSCTKRNLITGELRQNPECACFARSGFFILLPLIVSVHTEASEYMPKDPTSLFG